MKLHNLIFAILAVMISNSTMAAGSATVHLNGSNFIQSGSVLNTSAPGVDIVKVVYDLGTQADGIAIWEIDHSTGTHSNFLSGNHYSTETWNGLSVGSNDSFSFGGLDIDLIQTATPTNVTSFMYGASSSLANASVSVFFSDNSWGTANLMQQSWQTDQNLLISATSNSSWNTADLWQADQNHLISAVPEPETYAMLLVGLGLVGFMARRRKENIM